MRLLRQVFAVVLTTILFSNANAESPDTRFRVAQQLFQAGEVDEATREFDELRALYPDNVDYVFAYAIALIRVEQYASALPHLNRAIELAPDYEDVWRTKYNLLARSPGSPQVEQFRMDAAVRFPHSAWWYAPPPEPEYRWLLTIGAGYDALDQNYPDWNNQFLALRYAPGSRQAYTLTTGRFSRTTLDDVTVGLSGDWNAGDWITGVAITLSSDPEFVAESIADAYVGRSFQAGWVATLSYRHQQFTNAKVAGVTLGIEKYVGPFRLEYSPGFSRLDGSSDFSNHRLSGNWYYTDNSNLGVTVYTGREAEAIGGGNVLETDVSGISLSGRHRLLDQLEVQWWLGLHEQGDLYRRQFVGMAVSHRF